MIRPSIQELVARCQYVTEKDRNATTDSFRKIQWKQRRGDAKRALPDPDVARAKVSDATKAQRPPNSPDTTAQAVLSPEAPESDDATPNQPSVERLDQFLHEFVASEVEVRAIRRLPAIPSDPLGAVSIPSRREGHSVTLCALETQRLLVVFGGRQLRDLTNLLPVAANAIDPLKFERVRYVFSNGVYSYDLETTRWTLRQCTGKGPKERSDHSAVFVSPHFVVIFGGRGRSGQLFNDLWALSLDDWHWAELDTPTRPSSRYWHGACVTGDDCLLVFGGKSDVRVCDDVQHLDIGRAIDFLLRKQQHRVEARQPPLDRVFVPLAWTVPHTVGKPPSARFGLRMVRIDHDRLVVVGGWRASSATPSHSRRGVDVFVLDTMTLVWTKPKFSSHICHLSAPPERFLFECFYAHGSLVVFGGFTYATSGETELYERRADDHHVIYKLDLHRMIWRRQVITNEAEAALVTTAFPHFGATAMAADNASVAFTCVTSRESLPIELTALELQRPRRWQEPATTTATATVTSPEE